jgi:hypothetical protein
MKRGYVVVEYKGVKNEKLQQRFTLVVSMMEEKHLFDRNLDNPIDPTTLYCYNLDEKRWMHLELDKLDSYNLGNNTGPEEHERRRPNSISEKKKGDAGSTGYQSTGDEKGTQETQTNERGAEGQGTRESRQGTSSERTSKE